MSRKPSCMCILAFALMLFCSSAFAQNSPIGKGSKMLSGGLLFSSMGGDLYEASGDRQTNIKLESKFGYFVSSGFNCGGQLILSRSSAGNISDTTWAIGPQIVYFFGGNQPDETAKGATYPFLDAAFLYTRNIMAMEMYGEKEDYKISGTMVFLGAGICHMLSNTVGLMLEVSYLIATMKPEEEDSVSGNTFNIAIGIVSFLY